MRVFLYPLSLSLSLSHTHTLSHSSSLCLSLRFPLRMQFTVNNKVAPHSEAATVLARSSSVDVLYVRLRVYGLSSVVVPASRNRQWHQYALLAARMNADPRADLSVLLCLLHCQRCCLSRTSRGDFGGGISISFSFRFTLSSAKTTGTKSDISVFHRIFVYLFES